MNALELKNVSKSYKDFTLDNVSFALPGGSILGLLGENGAGKSTIIKLILGLVKKDSGEIILLGSKDKNDKLTKNDIGVVLDNIGFNSCFNAAEVEKIMSCSFSNWDKKCFFDLVEKLNIPKSKKISELSQGNKMKLSIAVALSHNAKLLILDEATNGLDPVVRDEITDLFMDFASDESHSVLISSHIVSDLEKMCDYISFLHKGNLLLFAEKDALCEDYSFVKGTQECIDSIDKASVIGRRNHKYVSEAIVKKDSIPSEAQASNVSLEELFVYMIRGRE